MHKVEHFQIALKSHSTTSKILLIKAYKKKNCANINSQ